MTVAYKDSDKCTDIILDFIARFESAGNYNALIGNARSQDDLGSRTIDQIYGLMDQLRANGRPSTAVGRYQIIKKTMQTLQARLNLPGSQKFTPEVQDRLAVELLVGRGYRLWSAGNMTDKRFAHAVSLEWASFPDPDNGGKSHYDGIGPNHAGTTLDDVYQMLKSAKAAGNPQVGTSAGPAVAAAPSGGVGPRSETTMEKSPRQWIKDVQAALRNAGFYIGDIDGLFGKGSREALDDLLEAAHHDKS